MKKLVLYIGMAFCLYLVTFDPAFIQAATSKEMALHVIRMDDAKKNSSKESESAAGDAVLLESKGKYLLMDTGSPNCLKAVKSYLKKLGVKKLDLYISHIHADHYGNLEALAKLYQVGRIYFPNKKYASRKSNQDYFYKTLLPRIQKKSKSKITYLKTGNSFTIGDATIKIIGPVGNYKISQFKASNKTKRENAYTNNHSLSAMVTCGDVKYFTGGDIEGAEEASLLKKYGKSYLKADIMKLSHHGIVSSSNSQKFLSAIRPQYSFVQNGGVNKFQKAKSGRKYRRSYSCRVTANQYGICVSPSDEGKDVVIKVLNGNITMYRGSAKRSNALTGWISVQGGDGVFQKTNRFYLNPESGKFLNGVQTIDGKLYYMGMGGCMEIGRFDDKGKYLHLKYYGKDFRYYEKTGEMKTGFIRLTKALTGQNRLVCFDPKTGYALRGNNPNNYELQTIGGKNYMVNHKGTIYVFGWKKEGDNYRYFDKSTGEMKTGWFNYTVNDKPYTCYLDETTGLRLKGLQKIDGSVYYFYDSGTLRVTTGKFTVGNHPYKADVNGRLSLVNPDGSLTKLSDIPN